MGIPFFIGENMRSRIETNDAGLPPTQTVDLASTIDKPELAVVADEDMNSPGVAEYTRYIAFFEEPVTFVVAESEDPNAPKTVTTGNNGVVHFLERGKQYTLARKFVDSLINVVYRITTQTYKDENNLDQTRLIKTPTTAYNISILNDPSGEQGRRWFLHKIQHG